MNEENPEIVASETAMETKTNMNGSDYVNARLGQLQSNEPVVEQVQEEIVEDLPVDSEELVEEPLGESIEGTDDNVLSQYNLDEMSEEELRELSQKLGTRAVARFGELTAKRKQAEERVAQLEAELQNQDPLSKQEEIKDNPFTELTTIEQLQDKSVEMDGVIEWAEDLIFNSDGYGAEDIITEVNGNELTKSQVRQTLRNARKTKDKYLPDRLRSIQNQEKAVQLKEAFSTQAKKELTWVGDENNEINQKYTAMMSDPRLKKLEEAVPELASQLPYILAHSANSMYGRKKVGSITPPNSSMPNSAQVTNRSTMKAKSIKETSQSFRDSGSKDDFIRLRTLQMTQQ
jgi:hypothetical protein